MRSRLFTPAVLIALPLSLSLPLLTGCGSSTTDNSTPPPPKPSINIAPKTALVPIGTNAQFFAFVSNAPSHDINWTASAGSIDQTGYYVAPASIPDGGRVTVTAASASAPVVSASADVTISSQPVSITISPGTATVKSGFTTNYRAVVDGTSNSAVLWTVSDLPGDDSYPGSITAGTYTAPNPLLDTHTYTIEAISGADPSKSAFATVTAIPLENQLQQNFPIELGTSGTNSNVQDCCSGTLGSLLVDDKGKQYLLSNNHVMGRLGHASVGETIVQPGFIDAWCDFTKPKTVATFTAAPLPASSVDAAIAEVVPGTVDPNGGIIGLGGVNPDGSYITAPPASTIAKPAVGMNVAKSGRTTGLSCSTVEAVNGTINVDYPAECGNPTPMVILFRGQLVFGGDLVKPGDSGSLIVEAATAKPLALVVAGSYDGQFSTANPVGDVITSLNALTKSKLSFVGAAEHPVSCSPVAGATARSAAQTAQLASPEAKRPLAREELEHAMAVQSEHESEILGKPAVLGVAIGLQKADPSKPALLVFVERGRKQPSLPATLDGLRVQITPTARFGPGTLRRFDSGANCRHHRSPSQ